MAKLLLPLFLSNVFSYLRDNSEQKTLSVSKPQTSHKELLDELLEKVQPIDFQKASGIEDCKKITKQYQQFIVADEVHKLAKGNKMEICLFQNTLFMYNGYFWGKLPKKELEEFLGKAAEKLGVARSVANYHSYKRELVKQFMSEAPKPNAGKDVKEVLINLQNGTFVITPEKQVLKHPEGKDFLTYQLPFSYDSAATCPLFQQYLDRVLPDKKLQDIMAEYMGYVFIRNSTLKLEKSLILHGEGANGKSVFFEVMAALLGDANISTYSLQSLTNDSGYQRAKLVGKLLNYSSEMSFNMDSRVFKQLISGEPIEARLPYGEPFILKDYSRFIFNTNQLPADGEHNEAYYRRFLIIPFNVTIPVNERDPKLPARIIKTELPGVFNWVLEGLTRLLTNGQFTESDQAEKAVQDYRQPPKKVNRELLNDAIVPEIINNTIQHQDGQYTACVTETGDLLVSVNIVIKRGVAAQREACVADVAS